MEPTSFFVGIFFLVSFLNLTASKINNYGGWSSSPDTQYHIQTDEGEERYFKYQTKTGQYRKEKRLEDGTVVGTYGWVDPNGYLRLRDYIADNQGYRIVKTKMIYVGDNSLIPESTPGTFHTKYSASGLPSITFQAPFQSPSHRFGPYIPPTPNTYVPSTEKVYLSPSPYEEKYYDNNVVSTPSATVLLPSSKTGYPHLYPSYPPSVEFSPNVFPGSSISGYIASTSPSVAILQDATAKPYANYVTSPKPINYVTTPSPISYSPTTSSYNGLSSSTSYDELSSSTPSYSGLSGSTPSYAGLSSSTPSYSGLSGSTPSYAGLSSSTPSYSGLSSSTPSYAGLSSSTPSYAGLSSTSVPVSSTPSPITAIGVLSSTTPPPPPPPVSGKFAVPISGNNNFITETEKNKLFYQYEDKLNNNYYRKRYVDSRNDYQEYDGIATVQNGFRYYLPRHYHEEAMSQDGQERSGSFGYIDPFGIRRVIYYNTSPGRGFVHRKNNRYVGFGSTPYDPRPTP